MTITTLVLLLVLGILLGMLGVSLLIARLI